MTTDRPVRILVVDEEEPLTHVVRIALELEGWEVAVARSGAEAIASTFAPDIVLLDQMLPDRLGTEVVADLRAAGSDAVVVFLTGRTEHDDRAAAYGAGGDLYLTKPFGLEELVHQLRLVVRRLGLTATSRRVEDLVLDLDAGLAWRSRELLPLTSLEFELLRELVEHRGTRMSAGDLVLAVGRRGIRVPRELTARMLARLRSFVNASGRALLTGDDSGWVLA